MELEPELVFGPAPALPELEQALLRPELALLRLEPALLRLGMALKADIFGPILHFHLNLAPFSPIGAGAGAAWLQGIGQSQCWSLSKIYAGAGAKNLIFAGSSHH